MPWITGVSISTDNIANYLASRGHKVTVVFPKQIVKGEVAPRKNIRLIEIPTFPFITFGNYSAAFIPSALRIIEQLMHETKFDIVHVQEPSITGVTALLKAKGHKIPIFGALHFIPEQVDRIFLGTLERVLTPIISSYIRVIYNKYTQIMTPSHFFANYLKTIGVKRPINVISNGTDIEKFHPAPKNIKLRKKLGFTDEDIIFFFLGRIDRDKNVETLVKAIPFADEKVKLLVVGKGTEKKFLTTLANRLKVENRIVWIDYITDEEMPQYYQAVDAFSIMSPYEGQSIVTLQAIASGLPVIAANASALPELVDDGKNGFLVESYDAPALGEKMNLLAKSEKLRQDFGKEGRKKSLEHDRPKVLHKLELIYTEMVALNQAKHIDNQS